MPGFIKTSLNKSITTDNSDTESTSSSCSAQKSTKNGIQLKITNMFGAKRKRSSAEDEDSEKKKIKCNDSDTIEDNEINDLNKTTVDNNTAKIEVKEANSNEICKHEDDSNEKINNDNSDCSENVNELKNAKVITDINKNCTTKPADTERCDICGQYLNNSDIIYYQGHPQNAVEEFIALTNEKLLLASGDDGDIMERPQTNITGKSYKLVVPVETEFGEYNLLKPSEAYTPLMDNLYEKIWLSKVVVEYLEENHYLQPTYEDLVGIICQSVIPELNDKKMSEEMLHKHAQFVCDQVVSLETGEDDEPLITLPCIRELIKLMGIKFGKRKIRAKIDYKKVDKKAWTKATTTPLVQKTFESFFSNQLDKTNHELVLRRKRCGVCEACQLPDCGECNACRAMAKFGGHGRTKKACVRRLCPNMAVEQAEDSEPEDEEEYRQMVERKERDKIDDAVPVKLTGSSNRKISWIGEPIKADATKVYYEKVEIDGSELCIGDFVMVETSQANIPALVTRVTYMWKESINLKSGYFHGEVFIRSSDTVLGEVGDPREVYLADRCCHGAPLSSILRKANVERRETAKDWFKLGGKSVDDEFFDDDGKTYFYNKYYERFSARFEDLPEDPICPNELRKHRYCPSCERKTRKDAKDIPKVIGKLMEKSSLVTETNRTEWTCVRWQDYEYKKGMGVFLKPGTFKLKNNFINANTNNKTKLDKMDEDVYPEYYRKSDSNLRGSNVDTGEPFCLGHIAAVTAAGEGPLVVPQDIYIKVNILYRPENTSNRFPQQEDLNVVYWSDEIKEISFSSVVGPCHLVYERNVPHQETLHEWLERDPSRFYFRMAYNKATKEIEDVPQHAAAVGRTDKGKDKGKGKGKSSKPVETNINKHEEVKIRPLRTLDIFAGCGGLSEGLHRSGVAECKWAVENVEAAAHAYSLNNRNCTVYNEDCNALLKDVMSGATHSKGGLRLPMQGEVELLCGGPPCQGFSGMNRFNSREYSNFKNSLVASYLSYCDYYRPKYFILENVRNFVAFKKGMVLKLTLRALLDMGYQCTFGILQAGNYGVPQTRRRLIILAAAPGYKLPMYPEPTHVFSRRACSLTATIDGKRFVTNMKWDESAPRRTCTIRDAMSDLPTIANGANQIEIEYGSMPESHFQRLVRSKDESKKLRDHICKNMAPLIQARIARIPTTPGSDWRDLPNISVMLSDGTKCKVLQYRYEDKKNGRSSSGALRGVCACASGGACSPHDKQENTLIPWCLPHTANRHNNWAGLYGRLCWDGYFSTTVTDPGPMGKQGRVLHPEQSRVVSVRECARSQGFPDSYLFAGSVQDKHRQIGNAVPPPLGAALGREIKKAFSISKV
ncbi:DNA (cytosine-5)-methyltransferase 1 [Papilio machaon]|uniref:DNA (cytosine-5)-methyltransferase n=1 Tax=Papilio machaon TaxID=76193 RepID=A0A194RD86_PAPMA|nr:DNA (cytosine-5)-methyltransferase 1 [Papilio machaon]